MTAVSGAHITIFIAVLCELFGKRRRRLTSIVSFAAVLLMMAMFGFSASVVRSGIMLMITQSAPLFCRRTDVLNSLCAALLLMTVLTPFAAALQLVEYLEEIPGEFFPVVEQGAVHVACDELYHMYISSLLFCLFFFYGFAPLYCIIAYIPRGCK